MISRELTDWTLTATDGPVPEELAGVSVPARVPGTSHTALLERDLIPDPYLGTNETAVAWMRRTGWRWATVLDEPAAAPDERVDLLFEGIDTVASLSLGGTALGSTANMHRSYRFDVRSLVGAPADLVVDLRPAVVVAEAEAERIGTRPMAYDQPFNMVRKMACSFGWDWGPDLQTAGLWKPVRVQRWRVARLARVTPLATVADDGTGRVDVRVEIETSGLAEAGPLTVDVAVGDRGASTGVPAGWSGGTLEVAVDAGEVDLWWPAGHGDQPLHPIEVTLYEGDGTDRSAPLDTWSGRVAFRTVEVVTDRDEHGTSFVFRVNGKRVFARGANWIPDDHLLTRITRERLEQRVDQARGAHLNLLRVWGGGIYESDDFYDVCDEKGVMVWQDVLLACAAYPEEEPHRTELEAELRENAARLAPHPSLVLWNGNNENIWGHEDWGWKERLGDLTWGEHYYYELFPRVLAEVDPTRPYSDGSPYSPGFTPQERHPNDPDHGTHHQWDVWNRIDWAHYRDDVPRFASEFGFQGPATWATLRRAVLPDSADVPEGFKDSEVFLLHQKAIDGNGKLDRGLAPHLDVPDDFVDWHWATQLNQARAVRYAVEHYRSWWPRTAGAIVWQLNDCWPVTSWAAVDGDGRRKPLWYALRHAFADRLVTVQPRDGGLAAALVNDTDEPWTGRVEAARTTLGGEVLATSRAEVTVEPRSVTLVPLAGDVAAVADSSREVLTVSFGGERGLHRWAESKDLALDPAPLRTAVTPDGDGYRVEVTATSLALGVTLLPDRLDPAAQVDDQVVDLPAGATAVFHVTGTGLDPEALTARPVLRTENDLVRAG
ncbi:glycoside hydrolase family 2 protein [Promicromonospora citrea]|uniref:beta-mannosidase n=1 Tax=Promicromonospora citrea TaxID=43677 RepID=A0A8H9GJ31_9MICO|nr:glycoside hydrolase family 2 protein [Promicromonospora citrea]NNH51572.1 glycoside hydrolase family 2 protein [Promicromonospora citrea]GGM31529.1 beta-mannosidase [Promicromonospora citrea]